MVDRDKIQFDLIKPANGGRILRLTEPQSGLALEKKLAPTDAVVRQKEKLLSAFQAALARVAEALPPVEFPFYRQWVEDGLAGPMGYLTDARMEAQSAENDVSSAQAGLESVLPKSRDVLPSTALFMVKLTKEKADYQDAFLENQPILKRLDANVNLAKAGVQAQTGRFMPDIYAFGKDELYRDDLTILDPKWAVGVGVKLPLFEGGQRIFDSAAARHQVKSVEALQEQAKRDLSALVDVRFQEMRKAQDRFTALESTVELARENERVRQKLLKLECRPPWK